MVIQRYRNRLSGPLLDRIDIQVEVPRIQYKELSAPKDGDSSAVIRERVNSIREIQRTRLKPHRLNCNAQMESRHLRKFCKVGDRECEKLLEMVTDRLGFSARTYTRTSHRLRALSPTWPAARISNKYISPRPFNTDPLTGNRFRPAYSCRFCAKPVSVHQKDLRHSTPALLSSS